MQRDLLSELYDSTAGIADVGPNPGAFPQSARGFAPQTPLRYAMGALGRTGDFAARNP